MEVGVANDRTNAALGQFLRLWNEHEAAGKTDGQLLTQFVRHRDEQAFSLLMRRHAAMVSAVCRRILGNAADAEDAFQATFLVLVRKAKSLLSRPWLGDWLHAVARRAALKARGASVRRRLKEQGMARTETQGDDPRDDWLPLLDEELSRLPEKYRLPIILCDLEGRTRQEAARQLDWPEGTVAGRLARARELLHQRLLRRGVKLSLAALSAALADKTILASVPTSLISSTLKAAALVAAGQIAADGIVSAKVATLMGEVMKTMLLSKLKTIVTLVVVCTLGGFGWASLAGMGSEPGPAVEAQVTGPSPHTKRKTGERVEVDEKVPHPEDVAKQDNALAVTPRTITEVITVLEEAITTRSLVGVEFSLDEFLAVMSLEIKKAGRDVRFLLDLKAFAEDFPEDKKLDQVAIKFSDLYPAVLPVGNVLQAGLDQIPGQRARVLIRNKMFFITTQKRATLEYLLGEKVAASYQNRTFRSIIDDLCDKTGVSINIDPSVEEKANKLISAVFRNDVSLQGALRIVTEIAGLKMVDMKTGLFITTPERAKELEKEIREAQK
jgi:RNA polymerase sigma factor (sigma-70 family)